MKLLGGYIRGLAYIAARHPYQEIEVQTVQDENGTGWLQAQIVERGAFAPVIRQFVLSPTGRVWQSADPPEVFGEPWRVWRVASTAGRPP